MRVVFLTLGGVLCLLLNPAAIFGQWTTFISTDQMTGERSANAISPKVTATEPMGFPYQHTEAWLGFGCDGEDEWTFIGFSNTPNLVDTITKDGHDLFSARVRWGQRVQTTSFRQEWGEPAIRFHRDAGVVDKMTRNSTFLLQLKWYGEGKTYFSFPLRGASTSIREVRSLCGS